VSLLFRELTEGITYMYFMQDSRGPGSNLLIGCPRRYMCHTVNKSLVMACGIFTFTSLRVLVVVDAAKLILCKRSTFVARTGRQRSRRITGVSRQELHCVLRNTFSRCKSSKEAGE
jgi:hypothetical protein